MIIYNSDADQFQMYEDGIWSHQAKVISSSTTFYIKTSGNDSNDGSNGSPWLSIDKAFSFLSKYILMGDIFINIEKGAYAPSSTLTFNHQDGGKIFINGDYERETLAISSSSGGSGAWDIVLATSNTSYYTVNDYIVAYAAAGGTNTENALGVHEVTSIDPGVSITVRSTLGVGTMAAGASVDITVPQVKWVRPLYVRSSVGWIYGVQVQYSAASSGTIILHVVPDSPVQLKLLDFIIVNTNGQNGRCRNNSPSTVTLGRAGIKNFSWGWFCGDSLYPTLTVVQNCGYGLWAYSVSGVSYVDGTYLDNTVGLQANNESYVGRGGGVITFINNSTDASPARFSVGNGNSYMG